MKKILLAVLILSSALSFGCSNRKAVAETRTVTFEAKADDKAPIHLCGAPTKDGHACRNRVKAEGDHCHLHGGAKSE